MIGLVLALALSAAPDGGSDVPFSDADAGIYEVAAATRPDGGSLPSGWWISSGRMIKLGATLVGLQNDKAAMQQKIDSSDNPFMASVRSFLAGMGVGVAAGIAISVLIAYTFK